MILRRIVIASVLLWMGCGPAQSGRNLTAISDEVLVQVDVVERTRELRQFASMASAVALREVGDAPRRNVQSEYYANIVPRPFASYFRDPRGDRVTLLLRLKLDRDAALLDLVRRNAPLVLVGWVTRSKFSNPEAPLAPPEHVTFKLIRDPPK